jgi:hypothetical protein
MTDGIKTHEDLAAYLKIKDKSFQPLKKGNIPRMFGLQGTFRDTGAKDR